MSSPRSALRRPSTSAVPRLMPVPSAVTAAMLAMTSPQASGAVLDLRNSIIIPSEMTEGIVWLHLASGGPLFGQKAGLGKRGAVALGILVEHLLAVAAAEIHGPLRELRAKLRGRAVDHHAADRVLGFDADRSRGRRLRFRAHCLLAAAMLDDLGEDAHGDLFGGDRADIEPGRRLESAETVGRGAALLHPLEDHRGAPPARDQADVSGVGFEHAHERVLVGVGVAGDDDGGAAVEIEPGERRRLSVFGERRDRKAGGASERGEALDDRSVTDEHELGLREIRLHVDLQPATAVARHAVFEQAFGGAGRSAALAIESDETGPAVAEGAQGFTHDDRLGAGAADPALHA